jgi:hypothetical protein
MFDEAENYGEVAYGGAKLLNLMVDRKQRERDRQIKARNKIHSSKAPSPQ